MLRERARVRGAEGWIDALPALIGSLERDWSLHTVGPPYESATEAYVVPVTLDDGSDAVLKLVLFAEPEYDLGILMREDPDEPDDPMRDDPRLRARWLADRTGLDDLAIWEWGVVERVSTGLLCTALGVQPVGAQMLAVADRIAASSKHTGSECT